MLFDDMCVRLTQNIQDELRGWAHDMLPAELTMDIGHEDYVCCSDLPNPDWEFSGFKDLP